jgi:hypothetical protein
MARKATSPDEHKPWHPELPLESWAWIHDRNERLLKSRRLDALNERAYRRVLFEALLRMAFERESEASSPLRAS